MLILVELFEWNVGYFAESSHNAILITIMNRFNNNRLVHNLEFEVTLIIRSAKYLDVFEDKNLCDLLE